MSQICKLFVVDVTNRQKSLKAEWEITTNHKYIDNFIVWFSRDEIMKNGDWKSIYIVSQMSYLGMTSRVSV